jgi:hypothetical protein
VIIPEELGTYLGTTVDEDRAQLLIDRATQLCESIVSPLPDAADAVVLDVVTRAYQNPGMASQQGAGPFTAAYAGGNGGLWLTRQNKATLRRLAGQGGAFTIDTMPATAGQSLPWWDAATYGGTGGYTDWDVTP